MLRFSIALQLFFATVFSAIAATAGSVMESRWEFRRVGDSAFLPAQVPGSVYLDLMANGLIKDPFLSDHSLAVGWVDSSSWEYRTFFSINGEQSRSSHLEMEFEGLDTYADVFVNGTKVLMADNMFRSWTVDIKSVAKKDRNELRIVFHSASSMTKRLQDRSGIRLPGGDRVFARKAAFQWGWDFSPRLLGCGIWKPVNLHAWSQYSYQNLSVRQISLDDSIAKIEVSSVIRSDVTGNATLRYSFQERNIQRTVQLQPGRNIFTDTIDIPGPILWWIHTLGEPYLYRIEAGFSAVDGKNADKSIEFGLRELELVREPDSIGRSFYFRLNGVPVFMKGANVVPHDVFVARDDSAWVARIVGDAIASHINMFRIWGGGIYPSDRFYEACDRSGILVWQDFMAACSMLPGDSAFLMNMEEEAVQQVRRIRSHPSLALWCGNNESDEGWHNWGWQKEFGYSSDDSAKVWEDYLQLFHKILPELVDRYDPGRAYWPSSPSIGWGRKESLLSGDAHYWGVWWGMEPFSVYEKKVGRFMSEYGFQGLPCIASLRQWCGTDRLDTTMPALRSHQQHPTGFQTIATYLDRLYNHPVDFNSYVYLTQVQQAEGVRVAIEAHRRNQPRCMGTLYWQFNDTWPGISWSSIDYYGQWKALQYAVRSAYESLLISPVISQERKVDVFVVSDSLKDWLARMELRVIDMRGNVRWSEVVAADIKANTSSLVCSRNLSRIIRDEDTANVMLNVRLLLGEQTVSESNRFFCAPRSLKLLRPSFTVRSVSSEKGVDAVVLRSSVFVKNFEISIDGSPSGFDDNYFDMLPGRDYVIGVRNKNLKDTDMAKLHYRSLFDTY